MYNIKSLNKSHAYQLQKKSKFCIANVKQQKFKKNTLSKKSSKIKIQKMHYNTL